TLRLAGCGSCGSRWMPCRTLPIHDVLVLRRAPVRVRVRFLEVGGHFLFRWPPTPTRTVARRSFRCSAKRLPDLGSRGIAIAPALAGRWACLPAPAERPCRRRPLAAKEGPEHADRIQRDITDPSALPGRHHARARSAARFDLARAGQEVPRAVRRTDE